MARSKKQVKKSFEWRDLLDGPRKWLAIIPACLLCVGASWWAYTALTVLPPPEASKSTVMDVVEFIGSDRGLPQLSMQEQRTYLTKTWQYYAQQPHETQMQVTQALQRMTPRQKEIFTQVVVGIAKKDVMDAARKYNSLRSGVEKARFAQQFYHDFQRMRTELVGGGTMAPGMNVTTPLNDFAPTSPQEVQKVLLNNTTPRERASAEPFIDKLAEVHQHEIQMSRGG